MANQYALPKRSYTEVALEEAAAKRRKDREEEAYRENYKAQGGQILTEGKPQGGLSSALQSGLEWLGYSPKAAYDRGELGEKAANLTPYGTMKQVHEGDLGGAAQSLVGGPELAMFLPFGSKNLNLPALGHRLAESLEKSGADPRKIFQQTGYFRDRDGNWLYEMGDQGMQVADTLEGRSIGEGFPATKFEKSKAPMVGDEPGSAPGPVPLMRLRDQPHDDQLDMFFDTRMGQDAWVDSEMNRRHQDDPIRTAPFASEIFKHDNLWEAAPDLGQVPMKQTTYTSKPNDWGGHFTPSAGVVGEARGPRGGVGQRDSMESVALHELQHAAQQQQGMPTGWNPNRAGSPEIGAEARTRADAEHQRITDIAVSRKNELVAQGVDENDAWNQVEQEMPGLWDARLQASRWNSGVSGDYGKRGDDFHGYMTNEGESMARLAQTRATLDPKVAGDTHPFENLDLPPSLMFRPGGAWGYEPEQAFHGPVSGTFGIPGEYDWIWKR